MSVPDMCVYQCPLCKSWQMDYSVKTLLDQFGQFTINDKGEYVPALGEFHAVIDDTVRDHLADKHPLALRRFNLTGKVT